MPANQTITRGCLRVLNGNTAVSRYFMFNPNEISDSKETSWGSIEVPGASHPIYQWGAGGERLISFDLYIDGDRGRFGRQQARNTGSLSVRDELYWYRSLVYPQTNASGLDMSASFPRLVLYDDGEMYKNLPVIVKKAHWKTTFWTPKREPVRSIVSIALAETVDKTQTADDILQLGSLTLLGQGQG